MVSAATVTDVTANPSNLSTGGRLVAAGDRVLPLEKTRLSARARGGVAQVVVEQTFINPYDEPLLVNYELPLPADGAVSGYRFQLEDRTVVGEVDTKHRARDRFEKAIASGKTAAILEQQRSNQFHQEVGNIPPKATVVCEVTVDQKLTWLTEGAWEWRFPTVVGPRYMGEPGRVPDAKSVQVPYSETDTGVRAHLELRIGDAIPAPFVPGSNSHRLNVDTVGSEHRVELGDAGGAALDRDVVVRWPVAKPEVGVSLDVARPMDERHPEDTAYGLLTLVPPKQESKAVSRDLIFLIDTSGSMGGRPLAHVKRIVTAMIDSMEDNDKLELIEFSSSANRWKNEPVATTRDAKRAATKWVKGLRASGSTEMHAAIVEALAPLRSDAQRQIVLITDGYIGFENEIIREIIERLPSTSRVHTIAVGSAPNHSLTGPAARAGGGVEVTVGLDDDVEPATKRLMERTVAPLITEVRIEGSGVETKPFRIPDLYGGAPALVSLRVPAGGGEIRVRGRTADGPFEQILEVPSAALGSGNGAVAALYGREWAEDLEARRACGRGVEDIDSQLEAVGLQFQIATRVTSWVAVDEEVSVDPDALRREDMPHAIPYGTSIEGFGLREAAPSMLAGGPAGAPAFGAGGAEEVRRSAGAPRQRLKKAKPAAPRPQRKEEKLQELSDDGADFEMAEDGFAAPEQSFDEVTGTSEFAKLGIRVQAEAPPAPAAPEPVEGAPEEAAGEAPEELSQMAPPQKDLAHRPRSRTWLWLLFALLALLALFGLLFGCDSTGDAGTLPTVEGH